MRSIKILIGLILAACAVAIILLVVYQPTRPDVLETPPSLQPETTTVAHEAPPSAAEEPSSRVESESPDEPAEVVRILGTVIDAETNAPIHDAFVLARAGEDRVDTSTDQNGAFILEAPPSADGTVRCSADGYTPSVLSYAGNAGDTVRLDFQLRPGSSVAGTVTDVDTGEGVEGVAVRIVGAQETVFNLMRRRNRDSVEAQSATTNDAGMYTVEGIPPGSYRVTVDVRDTAYLFKPESTVSLDVAEATDYGGVNFALERGGTVTGTVRDGTGGPVEDVQVILMPTQMLSAAFRGMDTLDPNVLEPIRGHTEADGTFTLLGVDYDTEIRAVVRADDYAAARSEPFSLTKTSPKAHVDLVVAPGSTVSGTARFPDSTPAPAIRLLLFPSSSEDWQAFSGPGVAATEPDGTFRIDHVSAGSYVLRQEREPGARGFGQTSNTVPVDVDGTNDVTGLEIVVQPEPDAKEGAGTIAGVVLSPTGTPAANVRVDAKRVDNPRETAGASTDEDGRFELTKLRGVAYDIAVDDTVGMAKQPAITVGSDITIRLQAPAVIGGVVVAATGEPVPGATVELKDLQENAPEPNIATIMRGLFRQDSGGKTTDAYGRFEFPKVAPGNYTVAAKTAAEGTAESDGLTVAPGQKVTNLRLVLDPGVTFSGTVVGSNGELVRGAYVQLVPTGENPTTDMVSQFLPAAMQSSAGSTTSDEIGAFIIRNIPAGTYKLVASHSDYAKAIVPDVQVSRGRDVTGYRVVMGKGGKAKGRYTVNGKPQKNATIMVVGSSGFQMVQTDSQGLFDVTGLPSGSYMIAGFNPAQIATDDQEIQFKPEVVDIVDGQVTDVDLGGGAGVPVAGVVSGAGDGVTVVALRRPGGPSLENLDLTNLGDLFDSMRYLAGQSTVGPDGSFSIDGVEPGDYILEVYTLDMNQNGPDLNALMNMPRTPVYRQNVTIGNESPVLNIPLGAGTGE